MKKLNLFFAMFLMVTVGFMSSCTKNEVVAPTVVVEEVGSPSYEPGTTVSYKITISQPDEVALKTFAVTGATDASGVTSTEVADQLTDGTFAADTYSSVINYDLVIASDATAGTEYALLFTANNGEEGSETASVVVVDAPMKTNTITLGAQSNTVGGAAASFEGSVFTLSESAAKAAIIDILYYNGSKGAAIYAPTQSDIQGISGWNWSSWSVKNATRFVMATDSDFTGATSSSVETLASSASLDVAENLSVGSVVAFTTINDKSGIFKVTSLDDSSTGTITIEVKIQDTVATK